MIVVTSPNNDIQVDSCHGIQVDHPHYDDDTPLLFISGDLPRGNSCIKLNILVLINNPFFTLLGFEGPPRLWLGQFGELGEADSLQTKLFRVCDDTG